MSSLENFMRPRVRTKVLVLTKPEARIVTLALRAFAAQTRTDNGPTVAEDIATNVIQRLALAPLRSNVPAPVNVSVDEALTAAAKGLKRKASGLKRMAAEGDE